MSALPNTLPREPRKPAARAAKAAKLNEYGRDPQSPSEQMRGRAGFAPFYHSLRADIYRLSSGAACMSLMLEILANSEGRGMGKGQPRPEWTLALSVADLAQICRCDVRTIERELVALEKRGLAEVKRPGKGQIEARLKYRDWESLPDYKSAVAEMPGSDETVEPEQVDESKPGNQRVTGKKPVRLPAGALSKVFPVSCGVRTFRYKADGPVDLDITAVIQAGELVVTSRLPDGWQEKAGFGKASSNVSNDLISPPRHGRRGNLAKVDHPRAAELIEIFDPLLSKSAAVMLVMDAPSLRSACDAVGDCNSEYLLHFVMQRADRGPIRKPQTVALICKEALASWNASKVLNAAGARRRSLCEFCGAPANRASKLTGRCTICDGNKAKATQILKQGGLSDAEIREIQG